MIFWLGLLGQGEADRSMIDRGRRRFKCNGGWPGTCALPPKPNERRISVDRAQKEEKVASLHEAFQSAVLVVVAHQNGMSVAESTELRREMYKAGAGFRVTKNRLARIALKIGRASCRERVCQDV